MNQPRTFGQVRVTPTSIAGKRLTSAKGSIFVQGHEPVNTREQEDWNREVQQRKGDRKCENLLKRL